MNNWNFMHTLDIICIYPWSQRSNWKNSCFAFNQNCKHSKRPKRSHALVMPRINIASSTIMRRTHERGTKARFTGLSGGPHSPVNMADNMEEVRKVDRWRKCRKKTRLLLCTALYFVRQVFANSWRFFGTLDRLFESRNSLTAGILHAIHHIYGSVWPVREAKPRFGAALERSAHDCETRLY